VLPDVGIFGGLMSSLTGYRAKPYLMEVLTLLLYWGGMLYMMREKRR
jgi:high-affinity iron transporter